MTERNQGKEASPGGNQQQDNSPEDNKSMEEDPYMIEATSSEERIFEALYTATTQRDKSRKGGSTDISVSSALNTPSDPMEISPLQLIQDYEDQDSTTVTHHQPMTGDAENAQQPADHEGNDEKQIKGKHYIVVV